MTTLHSQDQFAMALLDPSHPVPRGITTARGEADETRFAVYRNNVMVSLSKALAQRFPVTVRLVGENFFNGMARAFVRNSPPASPLMFAYGDGFPDFIQDFAPAAVLPYLPDVARLEAAWSRAYHAADAEPLDLDRLAMAGSTDLAIIRLDPHPAAALVGSPYAIGSIWQAHHGETVRIDTANTPEHVLVTRRAFDVAVFIIAAADAAFAEALFSGATLGEAGAATLVTHPDFDFGRCLVGLASLGAFAGISLQET